MTPPAKTRRRARSWLAPVDAITSLALTAPVFVTYQLGVLTLDVRNGVDFVTSWSLRLLDHSLGAYIGATLAVAAGLVVAARVLSKRGRIEPRRFAPLLAESALWALGMWLLVGWTTRALIEVRGAPPQAGPLAAVVLAAGAGFYEELIFRVGLVGGGAAVLRRWVFDRPSVAWATAAFVSAIAFSAIHYLGPLGDALTLPSFVFRALAGLYLGVLFAWRGFAVAVYCHMLYDVGVMTLR